MTTRQIKGFSNIELNRAIVSARNRRDAFPAGREPSAVMSELRRLLDEQQARRRTR